MSTYFPHFSSKISNLNHTVLSIPTIFHQPPTNSSASHRPMINHHVSRGWFRSSEGVISWVGQLLFFLVSTLFPLTNSFMLVCSHRYPTRVHPSFHPNTYLLKYPANLCAHRIVSTNSSWQGVFFRPSPCTGVPPSWGKIALISQAKGYPTPT